MAADHGNCIEILRAHDYPKIRLHDPGTGRSVVLVNPTNKQARRIRVDRCLAAADQTAADFVVSLKDLVDVIVELKGKNVGHAAKQIQSTLVFWSSHAEYTQRQLVSALIACKEYPRADGNVKRCMKILAKRGGKLKISTRNGEELSFAEFLPKKR